MNKEELSPQVGANKGRTCEVRWLGPNVMEFAYNGKLLVEDLRDVVVECKRLMAESVPKVQLVDTLGVTGVPMEIGSILNDLLESYRKLGGELVVMVATDQLNQMLGRSMSFGAGIRLELFDNRADALAFVKTQLDN